MTHDRPITISAAGSRRAAHWPAQTLLWSELCERLRTPARSTETMAQYLELSKGEQDDLKDVGGYVCGALRDGRRKAICVVGRDALTLDLDHIAPGGTDDVLRRVEALGCAYAVYSTRKHRPEAPRLRALLPLSRTAAADEYEPLARMLAKILGMELCDPTTFEASRLMYWPSCCADGQYIYRVGDKPFLDADAVLAMYPDWRDVSAWPTHPEAAQTPRRLAAKQGDPQAKNGVVGAFCRVYDVLTAMDRFIPGAYLPTDQDDRWTYAGGSTTGGAVLYDNGAFLFSHHATDPCGGRLVNAFDMVRLHMFGEQDDEAKTDTPTNKLPSYAAMSRLAVADEAVGALMRQERYNEAVESFGTPPDAPAAPADGSWLRELEIDPQTARPKKTTRNALLMMEGDPLLRGRIYKDTFADRPMGLAPLPWAPRLTGSGPFQWSDDDDAGLRDYTERVLGFRSEPVIADALRLCGAAHARNPVAEHFEALVWDGTPRLDTIYIDYFGEQDCAYTRAVARKAFVAAVARGMLTEVKFDNMSVLDGSQGIGKSTFFRKMGGPWFSDSVISFEGKDGAELIQGILLAEVAELHGLSRSDINTVKQFLSRTDDQYRAAYGKRVEKHPRRCVFFGTTNNREYLHDSTGNRRFWPVSASAPRATKSVFSDLTPEVCEQIWAEAVVRWRLGEPLYLDAELEAEAERRREEHIERDPVQGQIEEFLAQPIPRDWLNWNLERRGMFWSHMAHDAGTLEPRTRVCAIEIIRECLNDRRATIGQRDTRRINSILDRIPGWKSIGAISFGLPYGKQRGYAKDV